MTIFHFCSRGILRSSRFAAHLPQVAAVSRDLLEVVEAVAKKACAKQNRIPLNRIHHEDRPRQWRRIMYHMREKRALCEQIVAGDRGLQFHLAPHTMKHFILHHLSPPKFYYHL